MASNEVEEIFTPTNRSAAVWKYFGFKKDSSGKLLKDDRAICKQCRQAVAHGGGTTNLRNHLRVNHPALYEELCSPSESNSSKQDTMDRFLHSFPSVGKLSSNSQRARMLSDAIVEFIARDMRPVSVVDGIGFLNLMHVAEPRYTTPCRKTTMELIGRKYTDLKREIRGYIAQQDWMSLTTDLWTSKAGDAYISLTAHFVCRNFEMMHRNLETRHLPGVHDHSHLASALRDSTSEWCIDLDHVSAFTTDNGSNIVKTVKEDLEVIHLPCAGHTLNLAVQSALKVPAISTALSRCKKVITHFNQSRIDREELHLKQQQLGLPGHALIQDVQTRWNSTHDMIKRICEQQPAIQAVLHRRRDLVHLEISSGEWRILEDIADLLEPYKDATTYLSSESYPTISALGPLFTEIRSKLSPSESDSTAVRQFKNALAIDMDKRYQDPNVSLILNKASFLDPRFKSLAHLPATSQEETVDSVIDELTQTLHVVAQPVCSSAEQESEGSPAKKKKTCLEKLLGEKFQTEPLSTGVVTVSREELVQVEVSRYKSEPPLRLSKKPLEWWSSHRHAFPNLATMAQKYLGIVASSVPSERLFSTAGNVVDAKRAALLPENVNKLVFLHENLAPIHLQYRRLLSKCQCESCKDLQKTSQEP